MLDLSNWSTVMELICHWSTVMKQILITHLGFWSVVIESFFSSAFVTWYLVNDGAVIGLVAASWYLVNNYGAVIGLVAASWYLVNDYGADIGLVAAFWCLVNCHGANERP